MILFFLVYMLKLIVVLILNAIHFRHGKLINDLMLKNVFNRILSEK